MNPLKSTRLTGICCILLLGLGVACLTEGFAQTPQDPALSRIQPLENLSLELEFHPNTGTLQIVYQLHNPQPLLNLPEWVQMQFPFLGILIDRRKENQNRPILSLIDIRTGWVFAKKEVHWTRPDITFKWPHLRHVDVVLNTDTQTVGFVEMPSGRLLGSCKKYTYDDVGDCSRKHAGKGIDCPNKKFSSCADEPGCVCVNLGKGRHPQYVIQATCCATEGGVHLASRIPTIVFFN